MSLHVDPEFSGEEFGEEHQLRFVDGGSAQRMHAGDLVRLEPADIDVAERGPFALEDTDGAAGERHSTDFRPVKVDFVDDAVPELDIGEFGTAEVEVGDATVVDDYFLPHTVVDDSGTDPRPADLGMQEVASRHRPCVGPRVSDHGAGEPCAGEVHRGSGLTEVHPDQGRVEERRQGGIHLGEVEVGEFHAFDELLRPDIAEIAGSQGSVVDLRWAGSFSRHDRRVSVTGDMRSFRLHSTFPSGAPHAHIQSMDSTMTTNLEAPVMAHVNMPAKCFRCLT